MLVFNTCVARSVGKAEIAANKGAQAALNKEWDRLVKAKAWDESKVADWSVIAAKHRANRLPTGTILRALDEFLINRAYFALRACIIDHLIQATPVAEASLE